MYELFRDELHVDVYREYELEYLIEGLKFMMLILDKLTQNVSHPTPSTPSLVRMLSPGHHALVHSHRTTANRPNTADHSSTKNRFNFFSCSISGASIGSLKGSKEKALLVGEIGELPL